MAQAPATHTIYVLSEMTQLELICSLSVIHQICSLSVMHKILKGQIPSSSLDRFILSIFNYMDMLTDKCFEDVRNQIHYELHLPFNSKHFVTVDVYNIKY